MKTICILCLVASSFATLGCGAAATELQLKQLHTDVVRLKADNAVLSQRLQALEGVPTSSRGAHASIPSEPSDAPELAVVTLRPGGASLADADAVPTLPEAILEPGIHGEVLEKTAHQPASQK